ncbi:septum formation initiator family protein, partial [Streptomyces sp. NPDC001941]|uniref:FtsB family cell division protein n=1 Tax=Streptomyces sp. NPDC001941 TaxID=3154659 RepID=UPI0033297717
MSKAGPLKGRAARLAQLMPQGPSSAARTPFVLLVVLLLGGGLIALLLLNSSLNEGSFRLSELKRKTTELTDEEQALQRDVDDRSAPDALERRARELGMVPGGSPAFLGTDGKVKGDPSPAAEPSADPTPQTALQSVPEPPPAPSRAPRSAGPSPSAAAERPAAEPSGAAPAAGRSAAPGRAPAAE